MKRLLVAGFLLGAATLALLPGGADAQGEFPYDVKVEPDTRPRATTTTLRVDYVVTITEKGTGAAPPVSEKWSVFGQITNPSGGEKSKAFACGDEHAGSPASNPVPNGRYACTNFADRGGDYLFHAIVNVKDESADAIPVTLTQVSVPFTLESTEVYTGDPDAGRVDGTFTDVAWLWGHSLAGGSWFLGAGALAVLVLPALRKNLSSLATYRLERRLDLLVKLTVATTILVVFTGTYLLLNQTAYETPFSSQAIDERWVLPYARPYFLTIAVKLTLYALMILATIPLVRAAWRQLRRQDAGAEGSAVHRPSTARSRANDPIWSGLTGGAGATATATVAPTVEAPAPAEAPAPRTVGRAPAGVRIAAFVVLGGFAVVLFCVTLLKYFHELIEAASSSGM